jgi:uncharacterized membrane protein
MGEENSKTSTGIQQNSAGLLCYLGWWITGIIFLVMEKENKTVRFHAIQSIFIFGILSIILWVIFPVLNLIPGFPRFIMLIFAILCGILWIFMMIKAGQNQMVKLPWVGEVSQKYAQAPPEEQSKSEKNQKDK